MFNDQDFSFSFKKFFVPLTTLKAIHFFIIIGFIVFGNCLLNDFVADDRDYIVNSPLTHTVNLAVSFGTNYFNIGGQYRPIPATYFSILYALFGTTPFLYHVLQILLHIAATALLYVLFRKFLSSGIALFSALVFLVHPMQVESVSYIAQTTSPLFFLFGIIPLLLTMRKGISTRMLVVTFFLLLLSLLTKETGILFLLLLLCYSFLYARKELLKLSIGGVVVIVIYASIRFLIGHVDVSTRSSPIAMLSLAQRLLNTPMIMFYYLKTFFFPKTLVNDQFWTITSIHVSTFYLPLLLDIVFLTLVCSGWVFLLKCHKHDIKPFLFFFAWFVFGMLLNLQIFPLEMTVADRWMYFPIAGLLGLLGLLYQNFARKLPFYLPLSFALACLIIFSLSLRTMIRNANWQNELTLYTHDIQDNDTAFMENTLGAEYANIHEYNKSLYYLKRSIAIEPTSLNLYDLGMTYQNMRNIPQAKAYYEKALQTKDYEALSLHHKHILPSYLRYASLLIFSNSTSTAVPVLLNALRDYPDASELWLLMAFAYYKQHDIQSALNAASKAYQLNPDARDTYVYSQIQKNEQIIYTIEGRTFTFSPK